MKNAEPVKPVWVFSNSGVCLTVALSNVFKFVRHAGGKFNMALCQRQLMNGFAELLDDHNILQEKVCPRCFRRTLPPLPAALQQGYRVIQVADIHGSSPLLLAIEDATAVDAGQANPDSSIFFFPSSVLEMGRLIQYAALRDVEHGVMRDMYCR